MREFADIVKRFFFSKEENRLQYEETVFLVWTAVLALLLLFILTGTIYRGFGN